jgi:predicted ATPase
MISRPYLQSFLINSNFEEEYLNKIPALQNLNHFAFKKPVTFLVGENGSGKSTLLEALAIHCGFNPEGGTRNFNFSTNETHSSLYKNLKVSRSIPFPSDGFFLRAESFYNVATEIDRLAEGDPIFLNRNYGGKSLHEQSHGESFLALALNRFRGNSIFFLDEPEAALSPSRQMTLLARINDLVKDDSQFIIATHSPILMAYPHAEIIMLTETGIKSVAYEETEHYILTKRFLNNTERMLHYLFEEE